MFIEVIINMMNLDITRSDVTITVKYLKNQHDDRDNSFSLIKEQEMSVQVPDDHVMFSEKGSCLKQHLIQLIPALKRDYSSADDFKIRIIHRPIVAHKSPKVRRKRRTNSLGVASFKTEDEDDDIIALEPSGMYENFEEKCIGDLINMKNEIIVGVIDKANETTLPDLFPTLVDD